MPAVPTGSFRLAEQIGGWAIFADITLSVHARDADDPLPLVTCDDGVSVDGFGHHLAAIGFGVSHALGFIHESDCVGVIVHRLDTNPVDTTPTALAYVACHALLQCWELTPPSAPYFDRDAKTIVFPARSKPLDNQP